MDGREADESRLREVCESFLGPPTGMAEAVSSDLKNPEWDPCVLVRLVVYLSFKCYAYFLDGKLNRYLKNILKNLSQHTNAHRMNFCLFNIYPIIIVAVLVAFFRTRLAFP